MSLPGPIRSNPTLSVENSCECSQTCIHCLPTEILQKILLETSKANLSLVCRQWRAQEKDPRFIVQKLLIHPIYNLKGLVSTMVRDVIGVNDQVRFIQNELQERVLSHLSDGQIRFLHRPESLSIHVIEKLCHLDQALNLIKIWEKLPLSSENAIYSPEDPLPVKARRVRLWLEENPEKLKETTSLDLSNLKLSGVPKELHLFTEVTSVNLAGNQLSQLPPDFGHSWHRLSHLNLSFTILSYLPEEFGVAWTELESLMFINSAILALPQHFGKEWNKLQVLNLQGNHLSQLPQTFSDCWPGLRLLRL
ncbi:MAG: hypothetical protein ACE5GN_03060, partial [Waddliaceae bacterium]